MSQYQSWIAIHRCSDLLFHTTIIVASEEDACAVARNLGGGLGFEGVFPEAFGNAGGWDESLPRPAFDEMCEQALKAWAAHKAKQAAPAAAQPKPAPQLPPEVWQSQAADADRAWAAVVAMCGGTGSNS